MKFGLRTPSFTKSLSARTSWKRYARHNLGLKAPRGLGLITDPKKAVYNRIYSRTTVGVNQLFKGSGKSLLGILFAVLAIVVMSLIGKSGKR